MNEEIQIDLEKAIHFDPEKIKKMYDGDYKKVAKDLAIENTKLHIINSSKEQEIERLNNIIEEVREYIMSELITDWDIKNGGHVSGSDLPVEAITPILEILDKEKE